MGELPRTATPLAMPDVARVGARTFASIARRLPTRGMLAIQCAIIGLENAGGRAILQFNWGNISGEGPAGYWTHPKPSAGQPVKFRAYRSHDDGALAWWRLMLRRYLPVLERGDAHDPRGAVRELYRLGYVVPVSPGEEQSYAAAVVKLFAAALKRWIPESHAYPTPLVPLALGLGAAGAALGYAGSNPARNAALAGAAAGALGAGLGWWALHTRAPRSSSSSSGSSPPPSWPTAEPTTGAEEEAGASPFLVGYTWQRGQPYNHPEAVGVWFRGRDVGPLRGTETDIRAALGPYWVGYLRVWTWRPGTWLGAAAQWLLTYDGAVSPGSGGRLTLWEHWKTDDELARA